MRMFSRIKCVMGALGAVWCCVAAAQAWPTKPVTIVVPWPPGGPSDIVARPTAKGLSEMFGKTFLIDTAAAPAATSAASTRRGRRRTATRC